MSGFSVKDSGSRVVFFDGLRGWAAVVVLLCHTTQAFTDGDWSVYVPLFSSRIRLILDGPFAVYVFFVLSGVVLSIRFIQKRDFSLLCSLGIKRIPRLAIPIFCSVLPVKILLVCGLMFNHQAAAVRGGNWWLDGQYVEAGSFFDVVRFSFYKVFSGQTTYNIALWTMRVELLGSLLVIILLVCYGSLKRRWVLPLFFLLFIYLYAFDSTLLSFALGVFISYLYVEQRVFIEKIQRHRVLQIGIMLLFFLTYWANRYRGWGISDSFIAFLLVFALISVPCLQKLCSLGVSRFLGAISFPLYIVHIPIICSLTSYLLVRGGSDFLIGGISLLVSLGAAVLFYPFERFSIWFSGVLARYVMVERAVVDKAG